MVLNWGLAKQPESESIGCLLFIALRRQTGNRMGDENFDAEENWAS